MRRETHQRSYKQRWVSQRYRDFAEWIVQFTLLNPSYGRAPFFT
jgi:hypothetical protein